MSKQIYNYETAQYTFYRFPKGLITDSKYKTLSSDAKILYSIMLDRMRLSVKNNWKDKKGIFIYFTLGCVLKQNIAQIQEMLYSKRKL